MRISTEDANNATRIVTTTTVWLDLDGSLAVGTMVDAVVGLILKGKEVYTSVYVCMHNICSFINRGRKKSIILVV